MFKRLKELVKRKKKTPTPAPVAKPNLPANMLRAIAQQASPNTRRAMVRATTIPRRQMPIGLAVTKVGLPVIAKNRPPVINRSRATAKTPALRYSSDAIDRANPAAYKNNAWKYYVYLTKDHIAFANTRNGPRFLIDKKTGERKPFPARLNRFDGFPMQARKPGFHTWNVYQKRAMRNVKLRSGESGRNVAYLDVNRKVRSFLNGNRSALNNVPYSRLIWWAQSKNWMNANGRPYVKHGGKWYRYGGAEVTKKNVINDIKLMNSLHTNLSDY